MRITRFISLISLASFVFVAGCGTPKPSAGQLDELTRRIGVLAQQVHDLEVSNAELQRQVRVLQERERQPIPGVPHWGLPPGPSVPPSKQPPSSPSAPRLTPIETK
jgi:hypothetical protein